MGAATSEHQGLDFRRFTSQSGRSQPKEEIAVAHVEVDPDAVAGIACEIAAPGQVPTAPTISIRPAASDPVSTALAHTFTARMTGIAGYTTAARAITDMRAT